MKRFCYDGVWESWKVKLALRRARRMGFRDDELDDVIQDLVTSLMDIKYDVDRANGASEKTMLTSVIPNPWTSLTPNRSSIASPHSSATGIAMILVRLCARSRSLGGLRKMNSGMTPSAFVMVAFCSITVSSQLPTLKRLTM